MSVELEVISANGSIDLARFLDVEQGKGMEPGDPKFTEKVWARSLLKTGATLALETLREKEMIFPVKLTAANKDALTGLVQEINVIITTPGAQVKWQDEGASVPTFFSLISGQFDDEFDFRLGQNNWLKGRLRLFTQPLGYATQDGPRAMMVAGVATTTRVGTAPVVVFPASGALNGDAEALIQVQVQQASQGGIAYTAVSVLPSAEYLPFIPAASLNRHNGEELTESRAPHGAYAHWAAEVVSGEGQVFSFEPAEGAQFNYAGQQRVLAIARTPTGAAAAGIKLGLTGAAATPAATAAWQLIDFGTVSVASSSLYYSRNAYKLKFQFTEGELGGAEAADVAGVVQLPDNYTCFLRAEGKRGFPGGGGAADDVPMPVIFDGLANSVFSGASMGVPASGIAPRATAPINETGYVRGAIPRMYPGATAPVLAVLCAQTNKSFQGGTPSMNVETRVTVNVLEQTRYAF